MRAELNEPELASDALDRLKKAIDEYDSKYRKG
jgi:hypothetical protein